MNRGVDMTDSHKNRIISTANRVLMLLLFVLLLSGCRAPKSPLIVALNDDSLYLKDFYYEIYLIEEEGNLLEDYYQEKLGSSYWDYEYNGITMREAAKSSVITSVVMHAILADQAVQNGMELTQDELISNEETAKTILKDLTDSQKKAYGITYETLKESIDRRTLGEKYRSKLIEELPIDKDTIQSNINGEDYTSPDRYNRAVEDAITAEEDALFAEAYNQIKTQYDITIIFKNWDTVTIGK